MLFSFERPRVCACIEALSDARICPVGKGGEWNRVCFSCQEISSFSFFLLMLAEGEKHGFVRAF